MSPHQREVCARLRAEAKRFRELARLNVQSAAYLRALPIGQRQPVRVLQHECNVREYRMAAAERDRHAREIRAGLRPAI